MTDRLAHRGPDGQGAFLDGEVALGHRRLAIIDLAYGAQPMHAIDPAGRKAVASFCGEIFNFRDLRAELQRAGYAFETNSDTEVLLKGYLHWKEDVARHLNGMFAVAIWDSQRERLILIRDRLGVKPLYYFPTDGGLVFASEPKALFQHPLVKPRVTANGLRFHTRAPQCGQRAPLQAAGSTRSHAVQPMVGAEIGAGGSAIIRQTARRSSVARVSIASSATPMKHHPPMPIATGKRCITRL